MPHTIMGLVSPVHGDLEMTILREYPEAAPSIPGTTGQPSPAFRQSESSKDTRIDRVLEFIATSPIDVTLGSAAALVCISPSRLRHQFKHCVGFSFHRYVINARLERARHLLRNTSLSVDQIAAALGIADGSHFARIFKQAYGVSPGAARERSMPIASKRGQELP
jgi:transcriptional regulator GlxA family with amidase domain